MRHMSIETPMDRRRVPQTFRAVQPLLSTRVTAKIFPSRSAAAIAGSTIWCSIVASQPPSLCSTVKGSGLANSRVLGARYFLILKLVALTGSPWVLVTAGRPFTVGRVASCDLLVQDPTVSRHHAELELAGAGVRVRDVGSTNGTYLNGSRGADALAPPGSPSSFGKVEFDVREHQAPAEEEFGGEGSLDATILRQMPVRVRAYIAAQLADRPGSTSLLKIAGESREERQARKLNLLLDI